MLELKIGNYDLLDPVRGKEQQVIDCFVKFYGEKYRKIITERIGACSMLFIPRMVDDNYDNFNNILEKYKKKLYKINYEEFYKTINYDFSLISQQVLKPDYAVILKNKISTNNLSKEDYNCITEILVCKFNLNLRDKKINAKNDIVNSWLESKNHRQKICDILDVISNSWHNSEQRRKLNSICSQIDKIKEIITESTNINREQAQILENFKRSIIVEQIKKVKNLTDEEVKSLPKIEFYIATFNKILNGGDSFFVDEKPFVMDKKDYIELFKFLGFDYKENYSKYLEDSKVCEIFTNGELLDKIYYKKLECIENKIKNDPFLRYIYDKYIQEEVFYGNKDLVKFAIDFISKNEQIGAITDAYFDNNLEMKRICQFDNALNCGDDTFIHELCHVTSLTGKMTAKRITHRSGFFQMSSTISDYDNFKFEDMLDENEIFAESESSGEMLNEIITDYFSYKILDIFRENNLKVCAGKNVISYYTSAFGLMQDFIEDNLEVIKDAYIRADVKSLKVILSANDINLLSETMEEFFDTFLEKDIKEFENEIKEKTGLKNNVLYEVKPFIDKKIGWSLEIREFFDYYKFIDKLNEKAKKAKNSKTKLINEEKNK